MASKLTAIRTAYARGELSRAQKADGFQVSLVHDGGEAVTLWARSQTSTIDRVDENGVTVEYETRILRIPRQTGFSGGISENDEITVSTTGLEFSSYVYVVRSWDVDDYGAVWSVAVDRKTIRRSNV